MSINNFRTTPRPWRTFWQPPTLAMISWHVLMILIISMIPQFPRTMTKTPTTKMTQVKKILHKKISWNCDMPLYGNSMWWFNKCFIRLLIYGNEKNCKNYSLTWDGRIISLIKQKCECHQFYTHYVFKFGSVTIWLQNG